MTSILTGTAKAAHSTFASLVAASPIKVGDPIPEIGLKESSPTESSVKLNSLPGKIIIVGVPAAFSPSCSNQVPGYIKNAEQFKEKGVTGIYVVSVNDAFVTQAWKEKLGGSEAPLVHFCADDQAAFISALGLVFDATPFLGGPRSKRFALIVENGKVSFIAVEEEPPKVTVTAADAILKEL